MSIDRILSKLHRVKLLSTLDVRSHYCNITMDENSRKYTAFTTEYGKYEFIHVLFGIHGALSCFTVKINEKLRGLDFCFAYLHGTIWYKPRNMNTLMTLGKYLTTCAKQTQSDCFMSYIYFTKKKYLFYQNLCHPKKHQGTQAVLRTNRPLQKSHQLLYNYYINKQTVDHSS